MLETCFEMYPCFKVFQDCSWSFSNFCKWGVWPSATFSTSSSFIVIYNFLTKERSSSLSRSITSSPPVYSQHLITLSPGVKVPTYEWARFSVDCGCGVRETGVWNIEWAVIITDKAVFTRAIDSTIKHLTGEWRVTHRVYAAHPACHRHLRRL